jgi:outer membrane protein assembly factor BamB
VVAADDVVFCTAGYTGSEGVVLERDGETVRPRVLWREKLPDDVVGGALLLDGTVYATCYRHQGLFARKLKTGKEVFRVPGMISASLIYVNGRIIAQGHAGTIRLIDPTDGRIVSSFRMPFHGRDMWAHPAVSNGRLYIRHGASLSCFDITGE